MKAQPMPRTTPSEERQLIESIVAAHPNGIRISDIESEMVRLSKLGLVRVDAVQNDGHGQKKIVTPVATTISINASIAMG
jgi:hypothetical protein